MMKDVEEREVAGLLLQQKYDGVDHVNDFGEIKDICKIESSESLRILGIIHWLALPAVVSGNEKSRILIINFLIFVFCLIISGHWTGQ